uniref:Thioredoxin domain-containing protein n=1 Tax=Rhodosorus marinus TaxID=101924 RepID=A0A7S2ZTB2_9RHOD|mmetsp:Transcript_28427/g.111484  ORF Transcript_28427/g.111484 Transcript_28427/m.111484 type:complete len:241 (+) Transcript_28427:257-979(+)|eukprot:CAMPEP_0113961592 /NCGR_PEP_ID=MMETSP0011_2-20120614/5401_1 /TAXON_ID=101924 /ORGANISM="Rhodosorus marinus" /LENGTH=240 /DNA_ID=CAMNT_0000973263 /DNA_START=146 /DNA_END=868 /DNA_ORIENTATION=- /assembly_acc=CAM_ASM_000156
MSRLGLLSRVVRSLQFSPLPSSTRLGPRPPASVDFSRSDGREARNGIRVSDLRRKDWAKTEGQLTGPRVIQELRGFPNIVVETLSGESLKIREKFEDAKATILIMSHPQSGSSTSKDWCSPFKRQFVDHPHVQILDLTVNTTLVQLATASWTTKAMQNQVHEKRFDEYLVYKGRNDSVQKILQGREEGLVVLIDANGKIRWLGNRISTLEEMSKFSNAVLETLNDADKRETRHFRVHASQ